MAATNRPQQGFTLTVGSSDTTHTSTILGWFDNASLGGVSREALDITNQATSGPGMVFIPSRLVDFGTLTVDGKLNPDSNFPVWINVPKGNWKLTLPEEVTSSAGSGAILSFDGFVTAFSYSAPRDGIMTFSADIKISGDPTVTVATTV